MGVLDNVIQMRNLEQQQANSMADAFVKGIMLKQEQDKLDMTKQQNERSILASLAPHGLTMNANGDVLSSPSLINARNQNTLLTNRAGLLKSGLDINPDTGDIMPASKDIIEAVQATKKGGITADATGIPSQDQFNLSAMVTNTFGKRNAEKYLPIAYTMFKEGKTVDEIQDSLRKAGQSTRMTGDYRGAIQSISAKGWTKDDREFAMDTIDDYLAQGDEESAKDEIKRLARLSSSTATQDTIVGKERTLKLLDEIQSDLKTMEDNGIKTNIFSGTAEQVASRLGTVQNPQMREVATRIASAIQSYRRSMSGVAFSVPESKEYKAMFPSIEKTGTFNTSVINALKKNFSGDLDNFYEMSMGKKQYENLYKKTDNKVKEFSNTQELEDADLPDGTRVIVNGVSGTWRRSK